MIALGDLVDNGDDEYQWQTWFESSGDLLSRIPVAPALGNHEAYSLDWKNHMPNAISPISICLIMEIRI